MADTDILQAIRIIDEKIASLKEARDRLASAFGVGDDPQSIQRKTVSSIISPVSATRKSAVATQTPNGSYQPSERKIQLAEFLRTNGPMSRVDIVDKSGIPEGTVSYCLNDKRFFEQAQNGDWTINDFSRKGLEMRAKTGSFHSEEQ